ncbi:IclR family transcriptional regulator [Paeniglutamicibacter sp. NPDC091659]|uniref:IclR family transcriptional regulator n=1 Tax=Paeniglutamicibacter sp. NPDC091659 TaxID=3364389 RepID=UPI0038029A4B
MENLTEPELGPAGAVEGETPALRLFALLELITTRDQLFTLQSLVDQTGLPKPTLHRMLQQLEGANLLTRQSDGRHYGTGSRMRRMAEDVLLNDTRYGTRHAILRRLVDEIGESCNITALSGNEVIYLDRVETDEPIRVHLGPGSRVPVHCSASGKMILSQFGPTQRERVLATGELQRFTAHTLTDTAAIEAELGQIRLHGYALDRQEFLDGLVCLAVLVPNSSGRSNLCVAVQAPMMRKSTDDLIKLLPALRLAAESIARIEDHADLGAPESEPIAVGW